MRYLTSYLDQCKIMGYHRPKEIYRSMDSTTIGLSNEPLDIFQFILVIEIYDLKLWVTLSLDHYIPVFGVFLDEYNF